jgi:low affinity Fe/Cu permease
LTFPASPIGASRSAVDTPLVFGERQARLPHRHHRLTMTSQSSMSDRFNAIADRITTALGSLQALAGSVILVVVWALTGPIFNFSDTWQLFINTTTTVVTFWMVFVIQNSANRQSKATQLKLDEIIRAIGDARNDFIALDQAPEEELAEREQELMRLASQDRRPGGQSTGSRSARQNGASGTTNGTSGRKATPADTSRRSR